MYTLKNFINFIFVIHEVNIRFKRITQELYDKVELLLRVINKKRIIQHCLT